MRSSIQLAHGFGMTVVAEGVASEPVAQLLRQYRCDQAQGFYFGRPQPAVELERSLMQAASRRALLVSSA